MTLPRTGDRTDVRIAIRPYARVVGIGKAGLAFFAILAAVGVIVDASDALDRPGSDDDAILSVVILIAVLGAFAAVRVTWSNLRSAVVRKAVLSITPHGIRIDHEGIFKKPVEIARDEITVVAFDDRPARRRGRDHPRFSMPNFGDGGTPGTLYSRTGGSPFPLLGHVPDAPNVAIVFRAPLVLGKPRRFVKAFPAKQVVFPPLHARASRGLLIHATQVDAARRAFDDWGVVRPLGPGDLPAPGEESRIRARRLGARDNVVLGALILGQAALPIALADPEGLGPPDTETFSALGRICGAADPPAPDYEPPSESLGELLPTEPRSDLGLFFDSPIDTGDAAMFSQTDVPGWTARLLEAGFRRGYARRWSSMGQVVFATVWEFPTSEDAQDFESFARDDYCPFVQDAFLVPGLPDAVGMTLLYQEAAFDQVTFLRGRYRFMVGIQSQQPQADHSSIVSLTREIRGTADL